VRLWALRHRCWHLPRERRTPWRAAGREEGEGRGRRGRGEEGGGRPSWRAGAPGAGAAAGGTGTRRSEERKRDKTARQPGSGPKHWGGRHGTSTGQLAQ
jgi:hypothetical protein